MAVRLLPSHTTPPPRVLSHQVDNFGVGSNFTKLLIVFRDAIKGKHIPLATPYSFSCWMVRYIVTTLLRHIKLYDNSCDTDTAVGIVYIAVRDSMIVIGRGVPRHRLILHASNEF